MDQMSPDPLTTTKNRPNFVVFLTDDQGPWAMSYECPELVTPHLDQLAADAAVFSNFYCPSPVCSPARASLLTGMMPSAHGVHDWLVGERHPEDKGNTFLDDFQTLPQLLNDAGYDCMMAGKWHVGTSKSPAPGFSKWYAHRYGGGPYYNAPIWNEDGNEACEPRYFTQAVAEETCHFLKEYAQENIEANNNSPNETPFYLQVNFTAPHSPWINNHPPELLDIYKDCDFPSVPREEPHPWTKVYDDFAAAFADPVSHLRGYAAAISGVDQAVGQIVNQLDNLNLRDNTVIIYMSDNGFSCGHHGVWGKGNGTYPLNFWENSVRVPCIIQLPRTHGTTHIKEHISACAIFPLICNLASIPIPQNPLIAANSILPLLTDQDPISDNPVVVFDEYGGGRMIRQEQWKYIERYNGPNELYNLNEDPDERHNLIASTSHVKIIGQLHDQLFEWFKQHEIKENSAFHHDIRGRGQIHPMRCGFADSKTYVLEDESLDGVSKH